MIELFDGIEAEIPQTIHLVSHGNEPSWENSFG